MESILEKLLSVSLGGYVDIPQCCQRVGDNLILDPPDCCVPLTLFKFPAIFLRDGNWTASPVVRYIQAFMIDSFCAWKPPLCYNAPVKGKKYPPRGTSYRSPSCRGLWVP